VSFNVKVYAIISIRNLLTSLGTSSKINNFGSELVSSKTPMRLRSFKPHWYLSNLR